MEGLISKLIIIMNVIQVNRISLRNLRGWETTWCCSQITILRQYTKIDAYYIGLNKVRTERSGKGLRTQL